MPIKPATQEAAVIPFRDVAAFEEWLEENMDLQVGVWLKLAKTISGIPSLTSDEAVDVGLCFALILKLATARTASARTKQLQKAMLALKSTNKVKRKSSNE